MPCEIETVNCSFVWGYLMELSRAVVVAGTEQHRHNTAEVAVYSMMSYLWEIETGKRYMMTKVRETSIVCDESPHS